MKLILFVAALALLAVGITGQKPDTKKVFFMFFMRDNGPRPSDPKELETMQAAHIANMGAQAKLGFLVAAGPLNDPTKERRGITVLTVKDEKDIPGPFKGDPFVQHKLMKVEATEWKIDLDRFKPAQIDPKAIVEYRLVLLKRGKGMQPETEAMMKAHKSFLDGLYETHKLAVWGPVQGMQGIREVMIFHGTDSEGIEKKLREDAYVQKALLEVEVLPLWMAKGVFGD